MLFVGYYTAARFFVDYDRLGSSKLEPTHFRGSRTRSEKLIKGVLIILFAAVGALSATQARDDGADPESEIRLGARLFGDPRFSTPRGDLPASCSNCHLVDQDPQGDRAYTDFLSKSWVSARLADPRRNELRNTPTIFDVASMSRLHFDGEFGSLEQLVKGTFAGRPMGWLPGEESQGFDHIHRVVTTDTEAQYPAEFKRAFGVDVTRLGRDEVVELVARAVSSFMRTLKSPRRSPYDDFIAVNGLPAEPNSGEASKSFGNRLLGAIRTAEQQSALRMPSGFDRAAMKGLEVFLTNGNCVVCHAPPLFTDFSFHNIGISQSEYDSTHGEGSFERLRIPAAKEIIRPVARFRETPSREKPDETDLGHWNFVDLKGSPLRRPDEDDDRFLSRMIGAVKTPTLRHLAYTQPYMHTGAFVKLEDALLEIMRLSRLARAGRVRQGDDELPLIHIDKGDVEPLLSFLNSLNEPVPKPLRSAGHGQR